MSITIILIALFLFCTLLTIVSVIVVNKIKTLKPIKINAPKISIPKISFKNIKFPELNFLKKLKRKPSLTIIGENTYQENLDFKYGIDKKSNTHPLQMKHWMVAISIVLVGVLVGYYMFNKWKLSIRK